MAWNNKGDALSNLKQNDEAIKVYNKAIEISPHNSLAQSNLRNALRFTKSPSPNTLSSNAPSSNTPSSNTPNLNTPNPNTPSSNTPNLNTPSPNTPSSNTSNLNTPNPNTPNPNTPSSNTPNLNTPNPNTPSSMSDTMTELTSSANQYTFNQQITFLTKVDTASQETEKPSGVVTFIDGNTQIGIGIVNYGQAIFTTSVLSVGSHSIIAHYSGDNKFKPSTSSAFTLTITELKSPQPNLTNISNSPDPKPQSKPTEKAAKTNPDTNTDQTNHPDYLNYLITLLSFCTLAVTAFRGHAWLYDFRASVDKSTVTVAQGSFEKTNISIIPGLLYNKEIFMEPKDKPRDVELSLDPTQFAPKTIKHRNKFTSYVTIEVGKNVSPKNIRYQLCVLDKVKQKRKNVRLSYMLLSRYQHQSCKNNFQTRP